MPNPNPVNIDELISQLDELSRTQLHSRAQQLRRSIQAQIDALLQEKAREEDNAREDTMAAVAGR